MRFLLYCLLFSVFCSGCVLRSGQTGSSVDGLGNSYEVRELAERTAQEIQQRYSPAQTTLVLHRASGDFGDRLEQALRSNGFAVVPPNSSGSSGTEISYTADVLEEPGAPAMGYVQVRLPEGQFFSFSRELEAPLWPTVNPEPVAAPPALAESALPSASPPAPLPHMETPASVAPVTPKDVAYDAPELLPPHKVRSTATATQVAKRNKIPVADFCRWNAVMSNETLHAGHRVYLAAPPTQKSVPPVPAAHQVAVHVPVSAPVSTPASTAPAPVPAALAPSPVPASVPTPAPVVTTPPVPPPAAVPSLPVQLPVENIHEYEPAPVMETWSIQPGGLRIQIHGWAARAGYQLVWKAGSDFEMEASANFEGEFLKAVETLFAGMQHTGHALRVTVYQGNKVLEVTEG